MIDKNRILWNVNDLLDEPVYFQRTDKKFVYMQISLDSNETFTLRHLLENAEKGKNKTKSAPLQIVSGHRKSMFTDTQKSEIKNRYSQGDISKRQLAKLYRCSEKTIRNIIN